MNIHDKDDASGAEEPTKVVFKKTSRKNLRQRKKSDDEDAEEQ